MNTRRLRTILTNDISNILYSSVGAGITPADYKKAVLHLLDAKPGVLAQNVGMPDPVIYHTQVATTWDKYTGEVSRLVWPDKTEHQAQGHSAAIRMRCCRDRRDSEIQRPCNPHGG